MRDQSLMEKILTRLIEESEPADDTPQAQNQPEVDETSESEQ